MKPITKITKILVNFKNFPLFYPKIFGMTLVLLLFVLSLYLRLSYLNRPLGDRHEWVTAHALITIENFKNYPVKQHLFRLISTYPVEGNFFATQPSIIRILDNNGVGYYTTYPPFSSIFAYVFFRIANMEINILNIRILNIILHGVATVFVFLTVYQLSFKRKLIASLASSVFYIFTASHLWFYGFTYSWDIFFYYLVVFNLYILTLILEKNEKDKSANKLIFLFAIFNGLTIYTEFQGIFLAVSVVVLLHIFKSKFKKILTKVIVISSLIPVLITVAQYGTISGLKDYFSVMFYKFFVTYGSFGSNPKIIEDLGNSWDLYKTLLSPSMILIILFLVLYLFLGFKKKLFSKNQLLLIFILLFVIIQHCFFLFSDVAAHEFSSLKLTLLMTYLIGFIIGNISFGANSSLKIKEYFLIVLVFLAMFQYTRKSIDIFKWFAGESSNFRYLHLADEVNKTLAKDELLFFNITVPPQFSFYSKRNYFEFRDLNQAKIQIRNTNLKKGKFFKLNENMEIIGITEIDLKQ